MHRPLHPALQEYLLKVRTLTRAYTPSLFWEQQLTRLRGSDAYPDLERGGAPAVEAMMAKLGYGFSELDEGLNTQGDPDLQRASELADVLEMTAGRLTPKTLEVDKDTWEHARALSFLRRRGQLEDYLSFLTLLRVKSTMATARHYVYARLLQSLAAENYSSRKLTILEIGAGAGNLAVFLHTMGLVHNYTIVDLPEILIHSSYTVSKWVAGASLAFAPPSSSSHPDSYWFVVPQEIEAIPDNLYDLCLNFNSFMEMDERMLDAYFGLVYRTARPGALFVNVNRRQRALPQRDGTLFDNNPLMYPYRPGDRVRVWEEDAFQQTTRSGFGELPSLAVLRVAHINLDTA